MDVDSSVGCKACGNSRVVARGLCNACYLADRKHRLRYGTWESKQTLVDAAPAVEHLDKLDRVGMSRQQVVKLTGLHHTTVYRLEPGTRVHSRTVETILSVEPLPPGAPGDFLVLAVGSTRRLQGLAALGWPPNLVADRMGMANQRWHIRQIMLGENRRVWNSTARMINDVYEVLSGSIGPSTQAKAEAVEHYWAPPLAWDEDEWEHHIDNPLSQPTGMRVQKYRYREAPKQMSFAERYKELAALGYDRDEIARQMGIKRRSLDRMLTPSHSGKKVATV